jgi:hypothetical protein
MGKQYIDKASARQHLSCQKSDEILQGFNFFPPEMFVALEMSTFLRRPLYEWGEIFTAHSKLPLQGNSIFYWLISSGPIFLYFKSEFRTGTHTFSILLLAR